MKTQMANIMIFLLLLSATEDQYAAGRLQEVYPSGEPLEPSGEMCSNLGESCLRPLQCCPQFVCHAPNDPKSSNYECKGKSKGFSVKPLLPVPFFSLIVWWFSKPSPNTWFGDY